jgi:hypothetical protein
LVRDINISFFRNDLFLFRRGFPSKGIFRRGIKNEFNAIIERERIGKTGGNDDIVF